MTTPERRLAEALRAQASSAVTGAGSAMGTRAVPPPSTGVQAGIALLIALLAGAVLGITLALLSLLAPGVVPGLG